MTSIANMEPHPPEMSFTVREVGERAAVRRSWMWRSVGVASGGGEGVGEAVAGMAAEEERWGREVERCRVAEYVRGVMGRGRVRDVICEWREVRERVGDGESGV